MSNEKKSLPEFIEVNGFKIKKLVLGDYIFALEKVERIFGVINEIDEITEKELLANMGKILSGALPDVAEILAIASDSSKEEIYKQDMVTIIKMAKAFLQVNDFFLVIQEIKSFSLKKAAK